MSLTVFKSCDVGFAEESVGHGTWKSASEDEKRNGVLCGRFKNLCISFIFDQDMSEVANQNEILIFQDSLKKTLDKDCTLILTGK